MTTVAAAPHRIRYLETDAQGVVFNMWYLGFADEACADFLEGIGLGYDDLLEGGYDFQVVHAELDWTSSLRAREVAELSVTCERVGTTSFTLRTDVGSAGRPVAVVRVVYVGVGADGAAVPVPEALRERLLA